MKHKYELHGINLIYGATTDDARIVAIAAKGSKAPASPVELAGPKEEWDVTMEHLRFLIEAGNSFYDMEAAIETRDRAIALLSGTLRRARRAFHDMGSDAPSEMLPLIDAVLGIGPKGRTQQPDDATFDATIHAFDPVRAGFEGTDAEYVHGHVVLVACASEEEQDFEWEVSFRSGHDLCHWFNLPANTPHGTALSILRANGWEGE